MDRLFFSDSPELKLSEILELTPHDRAFVIMPAGCASMLGEVIGNLSPSLLIDDREEAKNMASLERILSAMLEQGLTRRSIVINIGGGVTTDIGGLAAALYMRGIRYINSPTTLLAMVDASSGGKTAVDLQGVKNIVGAFHQPLATIITPAFLRTLPDEQLLSGYAEMVKHDLLRGAMPGFPAAGLTVESVASDIEQSVMFKQRIVSADPEEKGLRRILNLGHTAGHAFEALALQRGAPAAHGIAVAQGLVTALVLSVMAGGFPSALMQSIVAGIRSLFPIIPFGCKDYEELLGLMHSDKKNQGKGSVAFTLLAAPGKPMERVDIDDATLREALDITRDLLGI